MSHALRLNGHEKGMSMKTASARTFCFGFFWVVNRACRDLDAG